MSVYWCPTCGVCWAGDKAPLCQHGDIELPSVTMVPIPGWHPMAPAQSPEAGK